MGQNEYYTITAVSLTSMVPVIYGIVFSVINSKFKWITDNLYGISIRGRHISAGVLRMFYIFILSYITLLLAIRLAQPVPDEGWLRTLFMITLLSAESAFVYSLIRLSCSRFSCIILMALIVLLFAAMPFGFMLHRPWNILMFGSPFYWLGWAWIVTSPGESLTYASIGVALSLIYLVAAGILLRKSQ
jgi:hypothetical protein